MAASFITLEPAFGSVSGVNAFRAFLSREGASDAMIKTINERLNRLNATIREDTKNLGPGFEIGHSYFCSDPTGKFDIEWYNRIVRYEVGPLLREYWFDALDNAEQEIDQLYQ